MIELPGYTLKRQLGRGGMALVYLATQESLHRDVALKFLTPSQDDQAGDRFLREARLAANLHHPHIVPIYDFGVHDGQAWLAMQYLPLGTVSPPAGERLESGAALRIVRDIASALDYAHGHGVVHRDIKPDNILRGENGAVLSDFGIARLIQGESALTREGTSVGTPHYMSPEQLRGERVDGRSDLYSLGVVLWQLLTGELPYTGTDGWAIGTQHLNADIPRLPATLAHLQPLMDALLAKTADARPRTGAEVAQRIDALLAMQTANQTTPTPSVTPGTRVLDAPPSPATIATPAGARPAAWRTPAIAAGFAIMTLLAWLGWRHFAAPSMEAVAPSAVAAQPVVAEAPSLAVLPFDDLSEKHDQSYFSDGMAEEVSIRLAQVEGLRVAGRASAQSFKGKNATIAEVGKVLNVSRVLEGTVRRSGDQLRVTVQLSNVADGFQLWSQTFDRKLTDVFAVQDEIAGAVVDTLKLKLLASPRKHTPSVDVYDLYLRGRQALIRANKENSVRAREALRQAVALDPEYAEAYGLLAMAEAFMSPGPGDPQGRAEAMRLATAAAERAVALDPSLGDAYGARGFLRRLQLDFPGALADTEKSVALGPREGRNYLRYGLVLETVGRLKEAQAVLEHAVELEPLLTPAWHQLGRALMARGDIANARRAFMRTDSIDPDYLNDPTLEADLLLLEGRTGEARAKYAASEGGELGLIMADYSLGKIDAARQAFDRFAAAKPESDPCTLAMMHAWLGQPSKAFVQLDRALATRNYCLLYVAQSPFLGPVRDDPRYAALLEKLVAPAGAAEPAP